MHTEEALTLIGRPFPDSAIDAGRTFTQANSQMEQDEVFQKFLADNNLADQRASLVVFGPENFMYWYGVCVPRGQVTKPAGLMSFDLPKAEVASVASTQTMAFFSLPLNQVIPEFLEKAAEMGAKIYQNLGDSDTPYVLQRLNQAEKKLTQTVYLQVSE
ncbi:hypothetical protein [Lactobacillus corticis]|uniref:Uncharacterized protein n=1 Tax=Lactobacillus corticis TaxID=2201249 RepID=A0A916VHE7_9LACO|nr:hypothetical protein [Lactobacillus corticis]GFZ26233.1 hypothetical protein LCB40_01130 [Lactobacillus corticis]